jgi:hypothetical protein
MRGIDMQNRGFLYIWPAMRNSPVIVYLGKEVDSKKKVCRSWLLQTFKSTQAQQEGNSKTHIFVGLYFMY